MNDLRLLIILSSSNGKYTCQVADRTTSIWILNPKDGEYMKIKLPKHCLILRHNQSGQEVTFTHNRARGQWYWHDDRVEPAVSRDEVVSELRRLLGIEKRDASELLKIFLGA